MTIGVFDSGIGGLSVVHAIEKTFPEAPVIFVNDHSNMPYGNKDPEELLSLVKPILQDLQARCQVIVIACNTIST
ncbi:MAG: glutamate racemase, partial [Candidatus Saccharimonadales bacterium]